MRASARFSLGVLLAGLASCGVTSGVKVPPFTEVVIGPGGGHASAGSVDLTVPPGAFDADHVLAILPQPPPLPTDPAAGPITFMPGLMCIGPLGIPFLVDGKVIVCYDPAAIPIGRTESELALLEWDEAQGFLRIRSGAGVTHDFTNHCFVDSAYVVTGHIGVGIPQGPPFDLVAFAAPPPPPLRAFGTVMPPSRLVLAKKDGLSTPFPLPNSGFARRYIPSRDGSRVLWQDDISQNETVALMSSDVADGTAHTLVGTNGNFFTNDPMTGWLDGDRAWLVEQRNDPLAGSFHEFEHVGGDGVPPVADLYAGAFGFSLVDIRVSPDGTMVLLRFQQYVNFTIDRFDVIDAVTGAAIGTDIPVTGTGGQGPMPRWLPDSSGVYYLDGKGLGAQSTTPDGVSTASIYSLAAANSTLQDFVVSPNYAPANPAAARCAYVRLDFGSVAVPTSHSVFGVDLLGGGQVAEEDLLEVVSVAELVYHPDGATVWADLLATSRGLVGPLLVLPSYDSVSVYGATDASPKRTITTDLSAIDIDRVSGDVVLWMQSDTQDAQFPARGLWLLSSDATTAASLAIPGWDVSGPARFTRSWRRSPSEGFEPRVR